ncbi:MAG TPA: ABC transporter permease [Bacteroidales bacterium]|nr:ABC transporter permease [Bacteroidales bacterium]
MLWKLIKKDYNSTFSLTTIGWKRFIKNKVSFSALLFIGVLIIISILGYLIVPDNTPFSNNQILEISGKNPGFKANILLIKKNITISKKNFLYRMFFGTESEYIYQPFYSYYFSGDSIYIEELTGDTPNNGPLKSYNIADVSYALVPNSVKRIGRVISFIDVNGAVQSQSIEELQNIVKSKHIIKKFFLLGTDRFGRDMLSRIVIGARISLSVGFISVFIALTIGIILGSLSGYYGGKIDQLIVWLINVVWSIPTFLLVIAITFALGKGFWQVFVAVGLTMWVDVARVLRGQIMGIKEKEFVEAAKALGYKNNRIIIKHILPNTIGPIFVIAASNFASAILMEAGLSFLGIGVQPPMPSWGTMIRDHSAYIILGSPWLAIIPGFAIMLTVLAFMLIGNGLRDAMDVKINYTS